MVANWCKKCEIRKPVTTKGYCRLCCFREMGKRMGRIKETYWESRFFDSLLFSPHLFWLRIKNETGVFTFKSVFGEAPLEKLKE